MWETDLLDEVALEGDISAGFVRNGHGDDVGQSLWLVDDSVSVRQVLPVLHLDLPASNHPAQLLLDLVWMHVKQEFNLMNMRCYFNSNLVWACELMIAETTLNMRVLGHEEQAPLKSICCGVSSSCKQIHHTVDQVVIMIVWILDFRLLVWQR